MAQIFSAQGMTVPVMSTAVAFGGAAVGVLMTGARKGARLVIPFGGGVLVGVAVFGLVPELSLDIGWLPSLALLAGGYLLLLAIDRLVYPVCPTCSHDHDHEACRTALHGFAAPLVTTAAIHSFFDGWNIVAAQWGATEAVRLGLPVAVAVHKIPEGIALGALLLAAVGSRTAALWWCLGAEAVTVIGAWAGLAIAPQLGSRWIGYPLALAAGCFFYLGFHAVHEEWRRRGAGAALFPALTGLAGAAALQQGIHAFFH
ncbi:MAG: ZIP family metal transporter [Bryobacterales bacterium]|nr:ZIP family metal transporter [Bryobacterales bacterium]